MISKLIVVDSAHPLVRKNLCFDPIHEYTGCGHAFNVRLARKAQQRKIDVITADEYLSRHDYTSQAVCLTDMVTPFTDKLLSKGVQPTVCFSLESPLNAKGFYHNITRYAGRFRHNYQFRGTQERLAATGTTFHPIVFPMETRTPLPLLPWDKRNYLVMINSNKRAASNKWRNLKEIMHSAASQVRFLGLKAIDPWMRIPEIYKDRVESILYFSNQADFSLYGIGWDQPIPGYSHEYHKAALKIYKGSIPPDVRRKREVMNGFKFALCFENCAFPGYITEKIFDCFLAGCIPVYFGAPDIKDFVPGQTFIDYRQFKNYFELDQYLRGMSESEAWHYLDAARAFLASPMFARFTVDHFVDDILNVIEGDLNC